MFFVFMYIAVSKKKCNIPRTSPLCRKQTQTFLDAPKPKSKVNYWLKHVFLDAQASHDLMIDPDGLTNGRTDGPKPISDL